MRLITAIMFAALFLAWTCNRPLQASTTKPPKRQMGELIGGVDELFAEWNTPHSPGAAVLLTHGGEIILTRCYGLANVEHGIPITPATRFELASVSKPFTAFAVLLLAQAGELNLDDDIRVYLPELGGHGSAITVRHLLHHTSGLSDWVKVRYYAGLRAGDEFSLDDLLAMVAHQRELEFEPGTKWSYSNTNYALLAEIVARVTQQSFAEWTLDNVFGPLGMRDTSFPPSGAQVIPNRACAYYLRGGVLQRSHVEDFEISGPAHAFSTIDDMARWIENLRTGRVGGRRIMEMMQNRGRLDSGEEIFYGAGLGIGEYRGVQTVGHSGQTGAFKAELIYCPEVEVGVVVLGNAGSLRADRMAREVLDLYLPDHLDPLPNEAKEGEEGGEDEPLVDADPAGYAAFVGGYRLETDPSTLVGVAREGDALVGILVGTGMDFFYPVSGTEFVTSSRSCRLAFTGSEEGHAARARIVVRGEEMWAERIPASGVPGWPDESLGLYYSDELGTVYEIAEQGEGIVIRHRRLGTRPLQLIDTDILAGGIGVFSFRRSDDGTIHGFDFAEPEDLGERSIAFSRLGP